MVVDLNNTVILITGAGTGLGMEIAKGLYNNGAKVASISLDYEYIFPDDTLTYKGDIFDTNFLEESVKDILNNYGHIDILINNIGYGTNAFCEELSESEFFKMFKLNVVSQYFMIKFLNEKFNINLEKVINISSAYSRVTLPTLGGYAATKFSALDLTKKLSKEFSNITFACICPGYMQHKKHVKYFSSEYGKSFLYNRIPLQRVGNPELELIPSIILLCSPIYRKTRYIELFIDGGLSAYKTGEENINV